MLALNYEQGYLKARSFCAYQERCIKEVRSKLLSWGLSEPYCEDIIAQLITENFLNEERFSKSFAGGKFRIKKWGWVKIKLELQKRGISAYCLEKAKKEIDPSDYEHTLKKLLDAKLKECARLKSWHALDEFKRNYKLIQFGMSRGYEQELVRTMVEKY